MTESTELQQDTSAQGNNTAANVGISRNEPAPGYTVSPVQKDRERCQAQLDTVHHQQATTTEGLQKLEEAIEKATLSPHAAESTTLTNLHAKRRSFEQRLEELASQEEVLTRHLEAITQKEQQARVEQYRQSLKTAQIEGTLVAGKIRDAILRLLLPLQRQLTQWGEQERLARNNLLVPARSVEVIDPVTREPKTRYLSADTNTTEPHFAYATGIDEHFLEAIVEVVKEAQRSENDIYARTRRRYNSKKRPFVNGIGWRLRQIEPDVSLSP